jgi:hypothetical protein
MEEFGHALGERAEATDHAATPELPAPDAAAGATNRNGVRFLIAARAYPKSASGDVRLLVKAAQRLQGTLKVARAFQSVKHGRLNAAHALESACHSHPGVSYF